MRFVSFLLLILGQAIAVAGPFVVTSAPVKDGVRITADLPSSQHHRNVGGSDGFGLCVYTSAWHAALWQSVSDLYGFRDWMTRRPGGSYPQKFEATLNAYCKERGIPAPAYVQHTGGDVEFLELALKTGRIVCVTYCGVDGPGRYGNEVIGHMVNLVHLDKDRAAILDNNFPGTWLWMTRADFIARWKGVKADGTAYLGSDGFRRFPIGGGWAIVLLGSPPAPYPDAPAVQLSPKCCCCEKCDCPAGACPDCPIKVGAGCVCGDDCHCKPGECPGKCPTLLIGQCPNGKCPLPRPSMVPLSPQSRTVAPGNYAVEDLPAATTQPSVLQPRPGPNYLWKHLPGKGDCWVQFDGPWLWGHDAVKGWGWVPKPVEVAPKPGTVGSVNDPFPKGGVLRDHLTERTTYRHNGEESTREQVFAALSLMDDSERWNLTIVGEPTFATKVREDISKLPSVARERIHVQSYAAGDWPVSQFKLSPGVTLRKPAVGRIGGDVGTVPVAEYSATKLTDLLMSENGPIPVPKPPVMPKPKVEPVPSTPVHTTPAEPISLAKVWIVVGMIVIAILLIRK